MVQSASANLEMFKSAPEPVVTPSPILETRFLPTSGASIDAFAVAPLSARAAIIVRQGQRQQLVYWNVKDESRVAVDIPVTELITGVAWQPQERGVFLISNTKAADHPQGKVLFLAAGSTWNPTTLAKEAATISHLVVSQRKLTASAYDGSAGSEHRLYYANEHGPTSISMRTVREGGTGAYTLMAEKPRPRVAPKGVTTDDVFAVAQNKIAYAIPASAYVSGTRLLWRGKDDCFVEARYGADDWEVWNKKPFDSLKLCKGEASYLSNGGGIVHWLPDTKGATIYLRWGDTLAVGSQFVFVQAPQLTVDNQAMLGLVRDGDATVLQYFPVKVPLGNIANVWQFVGSKADANLIAQNQGLLRASKYEQIYQLYDEEPYDLSFRDGAPEGRPYMVTTDALFEVWGAAFESLFNTNEQWSAMPAFWKMVQGASEELDRAQSQSRLRRVFATLLDLRKKSKSNPEIAKILAALGPEKSAAWGEEINYNDFQPRGYYTKTPEMQTYFRAVRFLTQPALANEDLAALKQLSPNVQQDAARWIEAYRPFIAPSRAPLAWGANSNTIPSYVLHKEDSAQLFPLSWGFDNEILNSVVMHSKWPVNEQVDRSMPSGLDFASVLGSKVARELLGDEISKTRHYGAVLDSLGKRFADLKTDKEFRAGLYHQWLLVLHEQVKDKAGFPGQEAYPKLWNQKRMSTGLASWATLRHTTVLVNDQGGAEGGEGGPSYEFVERRPPRGYVEPDPETFDAIAGLFENSMQIVKEFSKTWKSAEAAGLIKGVLSQSQQSRDLARKFAVMARKELKGQSLNDEEYETIYTIGGTFEHSFLNFKAAHPSSQEYALAVPDPMTKIADVARGAPGSGQHLHAAVGLPLEWNQVVEFFGRKQLVRGPIYNYQELVADHVITDEEWRSNASKEPLFKGVKRYFSADELPVTKEANEAAAKN